MEPTYNPPVGGLPNRAPIVALVVALAACGTASPSSTPAPTPDGADTTPGAGDAFAVHVWEVGGAGDPGESPIDAVWSSVLASDASVPYRPPAEVVAYRAGEVPATACATRLPAEAWVDNAFYCALDERIVYDVDFLREADARAGELAAIGILAHEWGHHVQALAGGGEFDVQDELMADCFAGMFASANDPENVDLEASSNVMAAFYALGNDEFRTSRWFQAFEHGSPVQRAAAWSLGYLTVSSTGGTFGYDTCRGYAQWEPGQVATVGPFTVAALPGRPGVVEDDGYRIEPTPGGLPGVELSHVDLGTSELALIDQLVGIIGSELVGVETEATEVGLVGQPHAAALYYAADRDPAGAGFEEQGFAALVTSADDPGSGLLIRITSTEPLSSFDAPTPDELMAALAMTNQGIIVVARTCAPHQSAAGTALEDYNQYCARDL